MNFEEIKVNNKLEFELEFAEGNQRFVKGLVLDTFPEDDSIEIVDEFGEFRVITKHAVLSYKKTNIEKRILDVLYEYKKNYQQKRKHEEALSRLNSEIPVLYENLKDARFLTNFNIHGAGIRLSSSIPSENLFFKTSDLEFKIDVDSNLNNQIELRIEVKKPFDYHETDNANLAESLLNHFAPDKLESLQKIFNTHVVVRGQMLRHVSDIKYFAVTEYSVFVPVSEESYVKQRNFIIESLNKLKRIKD